METHKLKHKQALLITSAVALLFMSIYSAEAATLSVFPSSQEASIGDTFTVQLLLNTEEKDTDGVGIRYLNYNPKILEVIDADATVTGVQISGGTLYPNTLTNTADTTSGQGKIKFSQVTAGGTTFRGQGILAEVTFKAIASGISPITLDFTPGNTTDTNVASAGADILASVSGGSISVSFGEDGFVGKEAREDGNKNTIIFLIASVLIIFVGVRWRRKK